MLFVARLAPNKICRNICDDICTLLVSDEVIIVWPLMQYFREVLSFLSGSWSWSNLVGKWQVSLLIGRSSGNRNSFFWSFHIVQKFSLILTTMNYQNWISLRTNRQILLSSSSLCFQNTEAPKSYISVDKSSFVTFY